MSAAAAIPSLDLVIPLVFVAYTLLWYWAVRKAMRIIDEQFPVWPVPSTPEGETQGP